LTRRIFLLLAAALSPGVRPATAQKSFRLRTPEILDESGKVRVFVGYDPENYFLEFDTFLDVAGNEKLLERLGAKR